MRLTRKRKRFISSTLIVTGIVLLLIFLLQITSTPQTLFDGCFESDTGDGEPLCMKVYDDTAVAKAQQLAIAVNPGLPTVGEDISIEMILTIPYSTTITASRLELIKGSTIIESWDLKNKMPYGGGSFYTVINTKAPSTEGSYKLNFYVLQSGTSNRVLYQESESFEVGGVDCPADDCGSYFSLGNVDNGKLYQRECSEYGQPPACFEDILFEYKLDCDSGYVVSGTDNDIYIDDSLITKKCVEEQQDTVVDCYACSNGQIMTIKQKNTCSSPLVSDKTKLSCTTTPTTDTDDTTTDTDDTTTGTDDTTTGTDDTEGTLVICKGYETQEGDSCSIDFKKAITDKEFYSDYIVWVVGVSGALILTIAILWQRSQKKKAVF